MRYLLAIMALFALSGAIVAAEELSAAQYAIKDGDGDPVANFRLRPEEAARIAALRGVIPVGNLKGDVTLLQFYDLNCPYCREAAVDIDALVRGDAGLKLVFVPYAVLSVQSVEGAMVELAVARLLSPDRFLDFHRRIYAGRGIIDAARVMAAAKDMGLGEDKVAAIARSEATLDILRENATVGGHAGLRATPAYVIGGVAVLGHPGLEPLRRIVAAMRACGRVVC
ncbi:MAG: thioredoxin domain-containing protein [Pseudolabrys sp.]|nr:thioredoxin domain-containing protein [Pseudolabrys sp.]